MQVSFVSDEASVMQGGFSPALRDMLMNFSRIQAARIKRGEAAGFVEGFARKVTTGIASREDTEKILTGASRLRGEGLEAYTGFKEMTPENMKLIAVRLMNYKKVSAESVSYRQKWVKAEIGGYQRVDYDQDEYAVLTEDEAENYKIYLAAIAVDLDKQIAS